jgi:hypothetical protein
MCDDTVETANNVLADWLTHVLGANDFILILPDADGVAKAGIRALFIARLGSRNGILIEGELANDLLDLYSLYAFTDKLIIGSFDLPHGRKLRNLLDSGVATEDELINDVILGAL